MTLAIFVLGGVLLLPVAPAAAATVEGWGINDSGQAGTGTASSNGCECIEAPFPVAGLSGVTQVAAGRDHTLALLANGTVMAWGANARGELGDGSTEKRLAPVQVSGLSTVVAISASEEQSLALLANGTVVAWGENVDAQLGAGESSGPELCPDSPAAVPCSKVPVQVPGLSNIVAISSGGASNLVLRADGTVLAWGYIGFGAMGDQGVGESPGCGLCVSRPTPVPGVSGAMAISAGETRNSALLADGTVKNWGENDHGGLGSGGTEFSNPGCRCLGPVSVSGLSGVRTIAAGGEFGVAALAGGGTRSWGFNEHGELGSGAATPGTTDPCKCIPRPVPVTGSLSPEAIASGERHSLALLPDGTVVSWGANEFGELGIAASEESPHSTPARALLTGASAVAAGPEGSFALIGPSRTLKVSLAGAGAGTVGAPGILCPSACEGRYPQDQVEILRAEGRGGAGFAGFSGACTGTAPCQVRMDQDRTLTATFGPPKGTTITKAKISSRRRFASFSFVAPGAITGYECQLVKPRPHHKHKARKAPRPRFSPCPSGKSFKRLAPGRYTFKVRARDVLGADADPATRHFTIKARRVRKSH